MSVKIKQVMSHSTQILLIQQEVRILQLFQLFHPRDVVRMRDIPQVAPVATCQMGMIQTFVTLKERVDNITVFRITILNLTHSAEMVNNN